jgi:hypothetical protein
VHAGFERPRVTMRGAMRSLGRSYSAAGQHNKYDDKETAA